MNRLKSRTLMIVAAAFLAGMAVQYGYARLYPLSMRIPPTSPTVREINKYKLTAPLLLCATYDSSNVNENTSMQDKLQAIISQKESAGEASKISVYYRGILSGDWVGINENTPYDPASLLKVPLMIAYLREAEDDPSILNKVLTYDGSFNVNGNEVFKSENDIKPGDYTIDSLLTAMIVNSDNNAMVILSKNINPDVLSSVYTDLGLQMPTNASVDSISPKEYSYFFRVLYNSTYLTPQYSEKALELLAGPDFPQGIQATVPSSVVVANKFGERTVLSPSGQVQERELHDCGIVYAPNNPYLVCIMTKGQNFQSLVDVIQSISKAVYQSTS